MNRSAKKTLYGLFYLAVFGGVGFLVYLGARPEAPQTAFPGGSLAEEPARTGLSVADQDVFRIRDQSSSFLYGKVINSSADFGARFFYTFTLFGADGRALEEVRGEGSVFPGAETLLYEVGGANSRDVHETKLSLQVHEWIPSFQFPVLSFSLLGEPRVDIASSTRTIRVLGSVRNESPTLVPRARVVALIRDNFGFQIFISGTLLANLRGFSEKPFDIPVPYDEDLARRARDGSVDVFFYPVF